MARRHAALIRHHKGEQKVGGGAEPPFPAWRRGLCASPAAQQQQWLALSPTDLIGQRILLLLIVPSSRIRLRPCVLCPPPWPRPLDLRMCIGGSIPFRPPTHPLPHPIPTGSSRSSSSSQKEQAMSTVSISAPGAEGEVAIEVKKAVPKVRCMITLIQRGKAGVYLTPSPPPSSGALGGQAGGGRGRRRGGDHLHLSHWYVCVYNIHACNASIHPSIHSKFSLLDALIHPSTARSTYDTPPPSFPPKSPHPPTFPLQQNRHGQNPPAIRLHPLHRPGLRRPGHLEKRRRGGLLPRYVHPLFDPPTHPPTSSFSSSTHPPTHPPLPSPPFHPTYPSTCSFSEFSSPTHPPTHLPTYPPKKPIGLGANLAGVTPEKAIKLAANDLLREALELPDGTLPLHREMMAGAGTSTHPPTHPPTHPIRTHNSAF